MDDDDPVIAVVDPREPRARDALGRYLAEIMSRVEGLAAVDASQVDDVGDYTAPGGRFLLMTRSGDAIGCGAVRSIDPETGELKRMWIRPDARGTGLGSLLLTALVAESRALGHRTLVLDTNGTLTEALALYRKHGFEPIPRYNDNPDATHFLGKTL